jgi:hypothetical protein
MQRPVLAAVLASALAAAGLVAAAPAAVANSGSCGSAPLVAGATADSAGPLDREDWWHYTSVVGLHLTSLTTAVGEADLYVYDGSCRLVCSSTDSGPWRPDVCPVTTPTLDLYVNVSFLSGPFDAEYVLTVV